MIDISNIQMAKLIERWPTKIQKSLTNRLGNEIFENLLIDHNVKLESISPNHQIHSSQHMKQVRLVRSVEPHYSYVTLITHVFIIMKVLSILIPWT